MFGLLEIGIWSLFDYWDLEIGFFNRPLKIMTNKAPLFV